MTRVSNLLRRHPQLGSLIFLIICSVSFAILSPKTIDGRNIFLSWGNIVGILQSSAAVSIGGFAMTLVLVSGGLDLSPGATIGLTGAVAARLMFTNHTNWVIAVLAALVTGILVGLINAILIVELKLPPFLATLGIAGVLTGMAYLISTGSTIPVPDQRFHAVFGYGKVAGFPALAIWTILILVIFYTLINLTKFGRRAQAIGGNETAAFNSGVNVKKIKYIVYALMGLVSAIVSLTIAARLQSAMPTNGSGYELQFIIAAVLGGTGFSGTGGNVFGTLLGSLILVVFYNGLNLLGVNSYVIQILQGLVIIFAIISAFVASRQKTI